MSAAVTGGPVWDDGRWTGLPRLEGEVEADVCVVGLGGSGLACAGELLRAGARVAALDAGRVAGGAAGRNGGFLLAGTYRFYHDAVRAYGRDRARAIYRLSLAEMDRIEAETPAVVRRVGSLRVAASDEEADDCRRQREAMEADGLRVEAYDGPEGAGLLIPEDGAFDPLARCRALARSAAGKGARLFECSPALEIERSAVRTPDGRVRCGAVVVAVDGCLERVLPELRGRVRTARLQMLATAPLGERRFARPVYHRWGLEYFQQLPDGRLALGGFRDRGGEAEWTEDATPTAAVQDRLEAFLRGTLGVDAAITHRWAAPVGFTASGLPVLDEVRPGVWAVGGYSGTGNVIGSIGGRAAARLALGEATPLAGVGGA